MELLVSNFSSYTEEIRTRRLTARSKDLIETLDEFNARRLQRDDNAEPSVQERLYRSLCFFKPQHQGATSQQNDAKDLDKVDQF